MKILKKTATELILQRTNLEVRMMLIALPIVAGIGAIGLAGMNAQSTVFTLTCQREVDGIVHCQRKLDLMGDLPKYTRMVNQVQSVEYQADRFFIPGFVDLRLYLVDRKGQVTSIYAAIVLQQEVAQLQAIAASIDQYLQTETATLKLQQTLLQQFRLNLPLTSLWMFGFFGCFWLVYARCPLQERLTFSQAENCFQYEHRSLLGKPQIKRYRLNDIIQLDVHRNPSDRGLYPIVIFANDPPCHLVLSHTEEVARTLECIKLFLAAIQPPRFEA